MRKADPDVRFRILNNATLPFILEMADKGGERALREDAHLLDRLNVYHGMITERPVAEGQGREYVPVEEAIG